MNSKILRVSYFKDKINPHFPCHMDGYGDRISYSQNDDLEIRSLLIESNKLIIFHVLDIILFQKEFADRVKSVLFERFNLTEEQIILEATHTHSGPKVSTVVDKSIPIEGNYMDLILKKIVKNTEMCLRNKTKVKASYGECEVNGFYGNRNKNELPYNNKVYTLLFKDLEDTPMVSFINIACHPTTLSKTSEIISSDFIGYLRNEYLKITGVDAIVCNGECGDVSTRFVRRGQDFNEVKRIGIGIAREVAKTNSFKEISLENMSIEKVSLRLHLNPNKEDFLIKNRYLLKKMLKGLDKYSTQYYFLNDILLKNIEELMSKKEIIYEPTAFIYQSKDFRFVTIPGELVYSLGALLRDKDKKPMFINAYSNEYNGYAVDKEQYGKYPESFCTNYPCGKADEFIKEIIDLYN